MVFSTVLQPMLIISDVVVELVVDTAVVRSIEEPRRCRNDEVEGNSIHMGFNDMTNCHLAIQFNTYGIINRHATNVNPLSH
jgi:hypothetical protein